MNLKNKALIAALFAASVVATSGAVAKPAVVSEIKIQAGKLELVTVDDEPFEREIKYKGKAIFKEQTKQLEFLSLDKQFRVGSVDLVVFSATAGAASPPDYFVMAFDASGNVKNLTPSTSISGEREANFKQTGDGFEMDLGYEDKKKKTAVIKADGVSALNTTVSIKKTGSVLENGISSADCKWLHTQVIKECISTVQSDKSCSDPQGYLSMASMRGLNTLTQRPGFSASNFAAFCKTACKSGQEPAFVDFTRKACGVKG